MKDRHYMCVYWEYGFDPSIHPYETLREESVRHDIVRRGKRMIFWEPVRRIPLSQWMKEQRGK